MKAIIIEDERLVARELAAKIAEVDPSIEVIAILQSLKTAINWFNENAEPDLVFADIQLSDGVSFDLFEKFSLSCPVIFTTAYNEYAIKAFKVNGIDYLLKPIEIDELQRAIAKAKSVVKSRSKVPIDVSKLMEALNLQSTPITYKEHFLGSLRNSWTPIKTVEIAYFIHENLNITTSKIRVTFLMDTKLYLGFLRAPTF